MRAALILVPLLCCTFLKNFATTSWWNTEYSLSYAHCKFYIMQKSRWDILGTLRHSLRGRRFKREGGKGKGVLGKGVLGARETRFSRKPPFPSLSNACHAG